MVLISPHSALLIWWWTIFHEGQMNVSLLEGAQAHTVSASRSRLSFVTLFSLRVGIRGERRESEVDNRCHHTRVPLRSTPVRDPALLLQHPLKHFHINNQAIFLHANPSKRAEANLRAWAASFFSGVPDSLADVCPTVCGTQSSCPVSTDWSEAGCGGGTQHSLSMMLYICGWKESSSLSTTRSIPWR